MPVLIFILCLTFAGLYNPGPRVRPGRCFTCDYELAGLGGSAACPECGEQYPQIPDERRPRPEERRPVLFVIVMICIVVCLVVPLTARLFLALDYVHDGYSFETAWRVIPKREWSNIDSDRLFAHFASLSTLLPGTPLLALHPNERTAMIAFAAIVVIALAFSGWSFA